MWSFDPKRSTSRCKGWNCQWCVHAAGPIGLFDVLTFQRSPIQEFLCPKSNEPDLLAHAPQHSRSIALRHTNGVLIHVIGQGKHLFAKANRFFQSTGPDPLRVVGDPGRVSEISAGTTAKHQLIVDLDKCMTGCKESPWRFVHFAEHAEHLPASPIQEPGYPRLPQHLKIVGPSRKLRIEFRKRTVGAVRRMGMLVQEPDCQLMNIRRSASLGGDWPWLAPRGHFQKRRTLTGNVEGLSND